MRSRPGWPVSPGGSLAKAVVALLTEEMHPSGLDHASREQRLGLDAVSGAGALADSLAIDDVVDVPDTAA
jgi:hypothetical protein